MGHILAKLLFNRKKPKNINSLPNEVLRKILDNLEVQPLIGSCRAVCWRWLVLAEDICRTKRSLMIVRKGNKLANICHLNERFHGLVDWNANCAILKLKLNRYYEIEISDDLPTFLVKLFPRVENLLFDEYLARTSGTAQSVLSLLSGQWRSTIVTLRLSDFYVCPEFLRGPLSNHLYRLTALKRLGFDCSDLVKQTTLARLEHHSFVIENVDKIVPHLGTGCTSLYLNGIVGHGHMTQWLKLNAPQLKSLTHLRLITKEPQVLSFICANCVALQSLNIRFADLQTFNADMIAVLARLSNLSQLSIDVIRISLSTLAQSNNLLTITSVRVLSMNLFDVQTADRPFDGDLFCRVLSTICPNLRSLTIQHRNLLVRDGIVPHLNRFVHLRKHVIVPN